MLKKQLIIGGLAIVAILVMYFGTTIHAKKKPFVDLPQVATKTLDIKTVINEEKNKLTIAQLNYINELENSITRGDVKEQQIKVNTALANFWKDSAKAFEPYAFYISEAALLDNSEKNLTFAAQLYLSNLRMEQDEAKINWQTAQAIKLFEKALVVNPNSDDLQIGLGSCYIFGKGRTSSDPQSTMQGVQKVLEVVRKDSTNMKAQLVLGIGGFTSGQYDNAIKRLTKVVAAEPKNLEAVAFLADSYAAKGDKEEAIKWYEHSKHIANDGHYTEEVDQRIKQLKAK